MFEIFRLLNELDDSAPSERRMIFVFNYVSKVMDISREEMHDIARKALSPDKEDTIMTLAERLLQEGKQIGHLEGLEEGRTEGRVERSHELLERLLGKRFGPHAIAGVRSKMLRASPEQVDIWLERLLDAETIDDVFA